MAKMNSKEVATAVVICTVRPIVCCLSKLELTSGLEGVKVWYTPVVLLLYDCVMLVCLAMSAYLRTRGHQAAVSAEVGTQSSWRMICVIIIRVRSQPGHMQILVRHVRVTTGLVLGREFANMWSQSAASNIRLGSRSAALGQRIEPLVGRCRWGWG